MNTSLASSSQYSEHYESMMLDTLNYRHLNAVLDCMAINVITMYGNNIKQLYCQYVERFVNVSLQKRERIEAIKATEESAGQKKTQTNLLCRELRKVKNDILRVNDPNTSDPYVFYDRQRTPQDYLAMMVYIMKAVEAVNQEPKFSKMMDYCEPTLIFCPILPEEGKRSKNRHRPTEKKALVLLAIDMALSCPHACPTAPTLYGDCTASSSSSSDGSVLCLASKATTARRNRRLTSASSDADEVCTQVEAADATALAGLGIQAADVSTTTLQLLYVGRSGQRRPTTLVKTESEGFSRSKRSDPRTSVPANGPSRYEAFEEKYEKASAKSSTSLATLLLLLLSLASAVFLLLMIIVIKRKVIDERRTKASHLEKLKATRRANDESGDEDEEDDMKSSSAPLADDVRNDPDFERYRIPQSDLERVKQLAKGAGGVVYLSKLKSSQEQVVVKQVAPEKAKSVRELQRFTREIRLYASLKHPKIVAFRGVAWSSLADLSLVLEYMPNGDLAQFLETQRKLDSQRRGWSWIADEDFGYTHSKLTVALDIADALVYLHSFAEPIMHRDLKAQNVLLSNKWVAKISDFGVSKKRRQRGEQGGSSGGPQTAEVGTAAWIAPEVIKGARYDQKADIYSFGVIMCELDTCAKPYTLGVADEKSASGMTSFVSASDSVEAEQVKSMLSSNATLALAVSENRATPAFHPDCPRAILDLARMCLSYNPRDRPTAKELCRCLQELVEPGALLMTSRKATLADSL
ncbi:hypothetical protein BBJ28_00019559 [Nothophytophthora sp. Chile5]|nr:hypothetical protein BBJ28_00019559 [Nothophytophthora sp. Chile5]